MLLFFVSIGCSPDHPVRGDGKTPVDSGGGEDTAGEGVCPEGLEVNAHAFASLADPVDVPHGPVVVAAGSDAVWIGTNATATRLRDGVATDVWTQPDDGTRVVPAVADIDGDGVEDLILGLPGSDDGAGQVVIFPGPIGDSVDWALPHLEWKGVAGAGWSVVPGDINGDGVMDLAVRDTADLWMIWGPIDRDGVIDEGDAVLLAEEEGATWLDVRVGDVDADGVDDLVGASSADLMGGQLMLSVESVEDPFGEYWTLALPADFVMFPSVVTLDTTADGVDVLSGTAFTVGDMNGDGVDDVLATGVSAAEATYGLTEAVVWLGPVGDGEPDVRFAVPAGVVGTGDLDGDGLGDVIANIAIDDAGLAVMYGPVSGLPGHDPATCEVAVDREWTNPSPWYSLGAVGVFDLDGDGRATAFVASGLEDGSGQVQEGAGD